MGVRTSASLLVAALLSVGCGKVSDEYATYADAEAAGLIEQAWLPPVLPSSATLIRIERDLDDGEAEGWFHFPSKHFPALEGKLAPYVAPVVADPATATFIAKKQTRGYDAYEVLGADARWIFLCSAAGGKCYFRRWAARSD